jgi:hypothetical protein
MLDTSQVRVRRGPQANLYCHACVNRAIEREALTLRSRIEAAGNVSRLIGGTDLSGMSLEELDALIARLQAKRAIEPPPDALERSRRAARRLAEAGALDASDGDGDDERQRQETHGQGADA